MKKILLTINILLFTLILTSCTLLDNFKTKYDVRYYHDSILIKEEKIIKGEMANAPKLELELGYELIGWYKDLEDIESKFDFIEDEVLGNLELHALVNLSANYIKTENFKINDNYLSWDLIEGATYIVNDKQVLENKIDLNILNLVPLTETTIKVKALKDGFNSLESEVKITYIPKTEIESQNIDMEAFDGPDFKYLNRSTYKSVLIDMEDFHLYVNEGRLTTETQKPKDGKVALVLREEGFIELKEEINNFLSLSFSIAPFNEVTDSTSTLTILASNDNLNYVEIKTISNINGPFQEVVVDKSDLEGKVTLNNLTFKLNTNITNRNLVIDNISVLETVRDYYQIKNKNDDLTLGEYYKTANGLKGKALVDELRFIISANLNPIKYSDIKEVLEFADSNLDDENTVYGIYDNKNHKANWGKRSDWHREHVWPNSRLGMDRVKENGVNQGSDPHNLRAITPSTNSSRSNRFFNNGDKLNEIGYTISNNAYYPGDNHRGDVARILFYMVIRYEFLGLTDNLKILGRKAYSEEAAYMGLLSILLDWHLEDPVNDFEIKRNEVIYGYQNNRNPFIDHPELLEEVFNYYLKLDEVNINSLNDFNMIIDISFFKKESDYVVN